MKVCSKCKKLKESKEFGFDLRYSDAKRVWCKECDRQRAAIGNAKRKELRAFRF
jgi:hypothetical protein